MTNEKNFENLTYEQKQKAKKMYKKIISSEKNMSEERKERILQIVIDSVTDDSLATFVQKKDGTVEEYKPKKIRAAIQKSAARTTVGYLTEEQCEMVISHVEKSIGCSKVVVPVEKMHDFVIVALESVRKDVAESYRSYHQLRKSWARMLEDVYRKTSSLLFLGDKDNANADSKLASTISCLMSGYLGTALFREMQLTKEEKQAEADGYLYFHDKDKRYTYPYNCCLFDIANVLKGGFEMSNIWYNEPKSLDVAFDVIGDVVLSAASQQYGGFTLPEIDKVLIPYAEKSYNKYKKKYMERCHMEEAEAEALAREDVEREFMQGFQGWEYKFNTVASSRGDYPFITVSFGLSTNEWGKMASICALRVRGEGQGKERKKKPVLFPKIVFLYDENLHGPQKALEEVFEAGVDCSSKAMYPDWLSLTGEGYVAEMYKKYGLAISPMGCRAFLSPWYERGGMEPADENDKPIFVGRFNIGAISLNLPMILAKARRESRDFYEVLDYYMNLIRQHHIRTYHYLGEMPASRSPLAFCEGGLLGGNLGYNDKIKPLMKHATASFGVTALNELQRLYNGKSIVEDGAFALEVAKYINGKVQEYKKEDGNLYAVYGTPAEKLCGTQVQQFRAKYGIVENVSDREYVSNSFHCHVSEDISPIEKQDLEKRFWDHFNGGKIQYVKYPVRYNKGAIRQLVRRAMSLGFYEGVNMSLSYCDDCGHQASDEEMGDICPVCGSKNLTKIDRMNGYLAYSRVKGDTRLNDPKMAEIADRKSM